MNLLILGYELPPIGGGTGRALLNLLQAWPRHSGWDIEVWTAAPPVRSAASLPPFVHVREFNCLKSDLHYWRSHEMALLLWKAWRKSLDDTLAPDAVLVWGAWPLAPLLWGRLGDIPALIALRGSDVPGFNPRTSGPFWKYLASSLWNRASVVTANSPVLARLAQHTSRKTSIEIIPNGVTLPAGIEPRGFPDDFSEGRRPFRVLSVSRLIPRKRVEWLVEAVSVIPIDVRKALEVTIAGDGPERYRLETMVQELDLTAQFRFLGAVPPDRMARLYLESDVFVHTSQAEGLSNALLEAMATGLPCLCSEPTGFADLDGAFIPAGSAGKLAQNLYYLLTTPGTYSEFSEACLEAASHYTWEFVAERYSDLLAGLVERH